jgi:hypothetical protein
LVANLPAVIVNGGGDALEQALAMLLGDLNARPVSADIRRKSAMPISDQLSSRRQLLSSFDHCYAVGLQRRRHSGTSQFILRTSNPLQPFRTTSRAPRRDEDIVALIA